MHWQMTTLLLKRKHRKKKVVFRAGFDLLAAAVAFFIFRKMGAKKKVAPNPYAPNNGSTQAPFGQQAAPRTSNDNSNIFGQSVGGSAAAPQNNAPLALPIPIVVVSCQTVQNLRLSYVLLVNVSIIFSR